MNRPLDFAARLATRLGTLIVLSFACASLAGACDTPVYRYAMYRWQPAPYEIYFFHDQAAGPQDVAVQKAIEPLADAPQLRTNVVFIPVDLREEGELKTVPPDVKRHWLAKQDPPIPSYMIVSPQGAELYAGTLTADDVGAIVDSPARQQLARELERGCAGVFVLLEGNDMAKNDAAEKTLHELAAKIKDGKYDLYSGPPKPFAAPAEPKAVPQEIGVLRISRSDAEEKWFVKMLLGVEDDLHEFDNDPMVFTAYGRGRVLPPYIDKGITVDNLVDCVYFVTGACSCTVKEQNPGVDLLVRYDWDLAAEKLAEKFGSEEGNERVYGAADFFPDLVIPPAESEDTDDPISADAGGKPNHELAQADPLTPEDASETETQTNPANTSDPLADNEQETPPIQVAMRSTSAAGAEETGAQDTTSAATQVMWTTGIGVGIGLFLLVGASLLMLRPR